MPYVRCPHCGLTTYARLRYTRKERCSGCDASLERWPRLPRERTTLLTGGPRATKRAADVRPARAAG